MLTIHRSKGLEFPIVYFPYLWEPAWIPRDEGARRSSTTRTTATRARSTSALDGPGLRRATAQQHVVEQRGEDLRLAYVALTRARHQAVVWWAGSCDSRDSALGAAAVRARRGRHRRRRGAAARRATPRRVDALRASSPRGAPGCISVERSTLGPPAPWAGAPRAAGGARRRALRPRARPALAAHVVQRHHGRRLRGARGERARGGAARRRARRAPRRCRRRADGEDGAARRARRCSADDAGVGVRVGTLVHRVLEATDFAARRPRRRAGGARRRGAGAAARSSIGDPAHVVAGPARGDRDAARAAARRRCGCATSRAPTGSTSSPSSCRWSAATTRPGGSRSTRSPPCCASTSRPATRSPATPTRLVDPALRQQRARLPHRQHRPRRCGCRASRFAVVDYKTNWLAAPGEPLTAWHHRPAALAAEMERAHYGAAGAALHRRAAPLPALAAAGLRPGAHLAGVLYLFLRGMTGPDTPRVDGAPCGVFAWRPPGALVDGAQRRARPGRRGVSELARGRPVRRPPRAARARRCCASSTTPACSRPPTCTSRVRLAALARRGRPGRRARRRARRPRAAARARLRRPRDDPRHGDGRRRGARRPRRAAVAGRRRRGSARLAASRAASATTAPLPARGHARSTSTATGARSARSPPTCARSRRAGRRRVDERRARRRARAAVRGRRRRPPARARPTRRSGGGFAVVAGGPGHRQDDDRRADRRAAGRAGRGGGRAAAARRARRADRQGGRAARGGRARRGAPARRRATTCATQLLALEASTLHRLLGWRAAAATAASATTAATGCRTTSSIVDETSMVSLSLMARLVEAVRPDARLVLVGDPGQLTSIEAGAVLGDIVGAGDRRRDRRARPRAPLRRRDRRARRGDPRRRRRRARSTVLRAAPEGVDVARGRRGRRRGRSSLIRRRAVAAGRAVIDAARDGRRRGGARGARRASALLCAHRRGPVRRRRPGRPHRGLAGRRRRRASPPTALVRGPAAARDRERLRAAALQRRHRRRRRRRGRARRPPPSSAAARSCASARAGSRRSTPSTR